MVADDEIPRSELLERIERLERQLAALGAEIAQVRALAAGRPAASPTAPPPFAEPVAPSTPAPTFYPPPPPPKPKPAPQPEPQPEPAAAPAAAAAPRTPPPPPRPPRRTLGELAAEWDLVGARGFAIAGGAVMALGIGFFFVLAANRGWIGDEARVLLGAVASALVFGAGFLLRARYGHYWSALAAVGAGVAGAYATLAAASARYDLVPEALALPIAAVIAGVATAVALLWSSQVIAAIGLLGAALAPALQALDTELTWESAAFAVLVLVAVGVVSVPRSWRELLLTASVLVGAQVEWLAADPDSGLDEGTVAVTAAFVATLLGIGVARQLVVKRRDEVDALALGYVLAALGLSFVFAIQVFEDETDRGVALLVAAGAWALVLGIVQWRRYPDLGLAVGASALAIAAVGTAHLLSDSALAIAWAAEALVFAVVARRLRDSRLQATGIAYAILATVTALVTDGQPELLFDEDADHLAGVLPLAAAAAGAIGAALVSPAEYRPRTESGLLAFLAELRRLLEAHRAGIRETLAVAGAALATLAVAFLLVSQWFEWGHVAASAVAAAVGAALLAAAGRLRSDRLLGAGLVWLAVVLVEAWAFDAPELEARDGGSIGGWSILAAAAGILGGAYTLRRLQRTRRELDPLCGVAFGVAFSSALGGVAWIDHDEVPLGIGWLAVAGVYAALAAGIFGRDGLRDLTTVLWSLALVALVGAEVVLVDDAAARVVFVAATALAVGCLSLPLRESRLWLAGGLLLVLTTTAAVLEVEPWLEEDDLERRLAFATGACALVAFALAGLRWRDRPWRDLTTIVWVDGLLALLVTERVLLGDWRATALFVALTGAGVALLAGPLGESRLWLAALLVVGGTTVATLAALTPPSHFFVASESPGESVWVLAACVFGIGTLAATAPERDLHVLIGAVAGALALYAVSLGILEVATRVSGASVETDFERGHPAVSGLWALLGLGLLVAGLLRRSAALRYGGLALFGLSLAKIFLYDLAELSSLARALSFIFVGGLLLVGGFFLQRLSDQLGPRAEAEPEI
jgi:uncharacterized membrane protein